MRWEGAAKRSEGSRAWGCKHCRGWEEGIGRNRSQRWVDTEYVSATANRSPPLPHQSDVSTWAEYYVLMNWTRDSLVISASQSFFSLLFAVLKLILMYNWDIYILQELPLWLERNVGNHSSQKAFFVSVVKSEVDFAVSAVTGWISHLDKHLQRKTNAPTSLYCPFNKRDEVADNLPRPAPKSLINSEGANKNQQRRRVSAHSLAQSFPLI